MSREELCTTDRLEPVRTPLFIVRADNAGSAYALHRLLDIRLPVWFSVGVADISKVSYERFSFNPFGAVLLGSMENGCSGMISSSASTSNCRSEDASSTSTFLGVIVCKEPSVFE
jgi:hypothetical protein